MLKCFPPPEKSGGNYLTKINQLKKRTSKPVAGWARGWRRALAMMSILLTGATTVLNQGDRQSQKRSGKGSLEKILQIVAN